MNKRDFPKIYFYDQDFVDIYDKTWSWVQDFWRDPHTGEQSDDGYFVYREEGQSPVIDQLESIFFSFFLVYSNRNFPAHQNLDYLYERQKESGAIRWKYNPADDSPVVSKENSEGISSRPPPGGRGC